MSVFFLPSKATNNHNPSRSNVAALGHASYDRQKAAWIAANPQASPRDYEAAMRRIAKDCGV